VHPAVSEVRQPFAFSHPGSDSNLASRVEMELQHHCVGGSGGDAYILPFAVNRRDPPLSDSWGGAVWLWAQPAVPRVVVPIGRQPAPVVTVEGRGAGVLCVGTPYAVVLRRSTHSSLLLFGCADP
jgi:hypothetical protein